MILNSFEGIGNFTKEFDTPMTNITIINDGVDSLTFTINGNSITILENEEFTETVPAFTSIEIVATGAWRCYLQGWEHSFATLSVSKILTSVRYVMKDLNKKMYSDYELIECLNQVLSLLSVALFRINTTITDRKATVPLIDGMGRLPLDFDRLIDVSDEYYIVGDYLYLNNPTTDLNDETTNNNITSIDINYKCSFPVVTSESDFISLPSFLNPFITVYCKMYLNGEFKDIIPLMISGLEIPLSNRENFPIVRPLPYIV